MVCIVKVRGETGDSRGRGVGRVFFQVRVKLFETGKSCTSRQQAVKSAVVVDHTSRVLATRRNLEPPDETEFLIHNVGHQFEAGGIHAAPVWKKPR